MKQKPGPLIDYSRTFFPVFLVIILINQYSLALALLIVSVVTGMIYLLDALIWSKKRDTNANPLKIIEYSRSLFPVIFSVFLVRSFLIEPFRIPSGSLEPTMLVGDFLVVNKFAYGIRLPVWEKKIIGISEPKHGDIVVFRWPPDPKFDFIKRVIGIPGDRVSYHHKILSINGKQAPQAFIRYTIDESSAQPVAEYQENLDSITHKIYRRSDVAGNDFEITVPPNQYFVMGDNRDDSADSRYWGFVDDKYLRGKAILTWLSWNAKEWTIRWDRIGRIIH